MRNLAQSALKFLEYRLNKCLDAAELNKASGDARSMLYWRMEASKAAYQHCKISERFIK